LQVHPASAGDAHLQSAPSLFEVIDPSSPFRDPESGRIIVGWTKDLPKIANAGI